MKILLTWDKRFVLGSGLALVLLVALSFLLISQPRGTKQPLRADASTFVVDYSEGPGLAAYMLRMRFEGDRTHFEVPGLGSFEARMEQQ